MWGESFNTAQVVSFWLTYRIAEKLQFLWQRSLWKAWNLHEILCTKVWSYKSRAIFNWSEIWCSIELRGKKLTHIYAATKKLDEKQSTNKSRTQTKRRKTNSSWWLVTMLGTFGASLMMLSFFFWSKILSWKFPSFSRNTNINRFICSFVKIHGKAFVHS